MAQLGRVPVLGTGGRRFKSCCPEFDQNYVLVNQYFYRKGGRVVECTGFENRRSFPVTEGSNPSSSECFKVKDIY